MAVIIICHLHFRTLVIRFSVNTTDVMMVTDTGGLLIYLTGLSGC